MRPLSPVRKCQLRLAMPFAALYCFSLSFVSIHGVTLYERRTTPESAAKASLTFVTLSVIFWQMPPQEVNRKLATSIVVAAVSLLMTFPFSSSNENGATVWVIFCGTSFLLINCGVKSGVL